MMEALVRLDHQLLVATPDVRHRENPGTGTVVTAEQPVLQRLG
jgi:hypothetical protein